MFLWQEQFMNICRGIYVRSVSRTVISAATSIGAACCEQVGFVGCSISSSAKAVLVRRDESSVLTKSSTCQT